MFYNAGAGSLSIFEYRLTWIQSGEGMIAPSFQSQYAAFFSILQADSTQLNLVQTQLAGSKQINTENDNNNRLLSTTWPPTRFETKHEEQLLWFMSGFLTSVRANSIATRSTPLWTLWPLRCCCEKLGRSKSKGILFCKLWSHINSNHPENNLCRYLPWLNLKIVQWPFDRLSLWSATKIHIIQIQICETKFSCRSSSCLPLFISQRDVIIGCNFCQKF